MLVDKKRVLFWVTKSKVASFFFVQRPRSNIPSWKLQFWHVFTNVFQESRKLVIAQLQNIVYNHFLPEILSPEILDKFGLKMASDSTYFPEANPTLKNEFSTAANRYGHSQIQVPQHSTEIKEFFCQWDLPWNQFWQMKNLNDGIFVQRGSDFFLLVKFGSVSFKRLEFQTICQRIGFNEKFPHCAQTVASFNGFFLMFGSPIFPVQNLGF